MPTDLIAGRYRIEREVGRGGMGAVWLCRDERLDRDVAVKQVGGLPGESSMHLARALREARHSAALNHPNVVAIFDAVEEGDHVWLVMEYVPSRTLDQLVREDGPLAPAVAARIVADVADGLAAAHALGTVHRDVKPSNVLVRDDDGRALIADFGIARSVGQEQLTRSGIVTGTPMYFAPELARGQEPSPASDVWALGVSLYAAVEGGPPYEDRANAIALLNTIASAPPPVSAHAGPLAPVLERMLDLDPATRCSMAEAADALRGIADAPPPVGPAPETEVLPTPAAAPPPQTVPTRTRPDDDRRRPVAWVVVTLVAVALVAVGGWWLTRDGAGDETGAQGTRGAGRSSAPPAPSSSSPSSSEAASSAPTTRSSDPEPDASSEPPPPPEPPEPDDDAAAFVTDYYGLLPEDVDTSWQMLSPELQDEVGRDSFVGFWATIDEVTVDDVKTDGTTVTVVLTYDTDGRTEQETRELTVEEQDGGLLITEDSGAV